MKDKKITIIQVIIIILIIIGMIIASIMFFTNNNEKNDSNVSNRSNNLINEEKNETPIFNDIIEGSKINSEDYVDTNIIAHIDIHIPSVIENSTTYTYYIYKKNNGKYAYKKVKTEMWIRETTSKETVDSGNIQNKEDLEMIQKDIDEHIIEGYSNVGIYYQNERLNTLEELLEKLF